MHYVIHWDDNFERKVVSPALENYRAALNYAKVAREYEPVITVVVAAQLEDESRDRVLMTAPELRVRED